MKVAGVSPSTPFDKVMNRVKQIVCTQVCIVKKKVHTGGVSCELRWFMRSRSIGVCNVRQLKAHFVEEEILSAHFERHEEKILKLSVLFSMYKKQKSWKNDKSGDSLMAKVLVYFWLDSSVLLKKMKMGVMLKAFFRWLLLIRKTKVSKLED